MVTTIGTKFVYFFEEGDGSMKELLGGKGAGLAEMTRAGLPVPEGFIITTEACLEFYNAKRTFPAGLEDEVKRSMAELERRTGKRFGDPADPLLVSVRSGARVSMPGMMDTILNLGLNDQTVDGLARLTNNERFAWDAYRRFITMFSGVVLDIEKEHFDELIEERKRELGVENDPQIDADSWRALVASFKKIVRKHAGRDFPQDVTEQLHLAIEAVFDSWNSRARDRLSAFQQDLRRLGHRGQRRADGLRQHGRRLGDRRCVHARSEYRRK